MGEILIVFFFCSGNDRAAVLFGSTWQVLQATPRIKLEDLYNFSQHSPSRGEASSPFSDLEKQHSWASGRLHTTMSMSTACRPALAAGENRGAARSQQHVLGERWAGCLDPAQASQLPVQKELCLSTLQQPTHTVTNTQETDTALWHRKGQNLDNPTERQEACSYGGKGENSAELTQDTQALLSWVRQKGQ